MCVSLGLNQMGTVVRRRGAGGPSGTLNRPACGLCEGHRAAGAPQDAQTTPSPPVIAGLSARDVLPTSI